MLKKRRKWPYIVLGIVAFVGFLLLIAQDQDVLHVESSLRATDARFADYVASLLGAPVTSGDAYEQLLNGDRIFPAMLAEIKQAQRRISFESFIYSHGAVSHEFTEALASAAARGVTVRIVLDAIGAADLPSEYLKRLEQAGVQTAWFNLLRPWTLEETNYRTHRKLLVADGSVAFTGGVALADHWAR